MGVCHLVLRTKPFRAWFPPSIINYSSWCESGKSLREFVPFCRNLLTNVKKATRTMTTSWLCPVCGEGGKTLFHFFRDCRKSFGIWNCVKICNPIFFFNFSIWKDQLIGNLTQKSIDLRNPPGRFSLEPPLIRSGGTRMRGFSFINYFLPKLRSLKYRIVWTGLLHVTTWDLSFTSLLTSLLRKSVLVESPL